ncbi:MAG: hypothetical protein WCK37_03325 [Candidatus Falkowbacteria bacterium]
METAVSKPTAGINPATAYFYKIMIESIALSEYKTVYKNKKPQVILKSEQVAVDLQKERQERVTQIKELVNELLSSVSIMEIEFIKPEKIRDEMALANERYNISKLIRYNSIGIKKPEKKPVVHVPVEKITFSFMDVAKTNMFENFTDIYEYIVELAENKAREWNTYYYPEEMDVKITYLRKITDDNIKKSTWQDRMLIGLTVTK